MPRIAGAVPMTPLSSQLGDLVVVEAQLGEHLVVVLPEQRRGRPVETLRARREPHRKRAVPGGPVDGMVDLLEEAAVRQLRQARPARCGCITFATGTPASHRLSTISSPVRVPHHRLRCSSITSWCRRRPAAVSELVGHRPVGVPERVATRLAHCVVGGDRDRHPAVGPAELVDLAGAVQVLRRGGRARGSRPAAAGRRRRSAR